MTGYLLPIIAYLLGSVPFGVILASLFHGKDPRVTGSRNIGATNVRRAAGKTAAALTLAADILKGAVPVYAAWAMALHPSIVALSGLGAFLGHLYPVFLGFRGGKGVATACGVMAVVSPLATALALVVFIITVAAKRYVSLGSMLAASSMPVFLYLLPGARDFPGLGVVIAAFIIFRHRANIKRLLQGEENRL